MRIAGLIGLVTALGCVAPKTIAEDSAKSSKFPLFGTWEVERVYIDSRAGSGRDSLPDDPSLVGRALVLKETELHFMHRGWTDCVQRQWKPISTTWRKLFADGLCARSAGPVDEDATPDFFQVPLRPNDKVTVFPICEKEIPRKHVLNGPWIATDRSDRLVMPETCQTLLVFKRRTSRAPIEPSFACTRAKTITERAICSDVDLAGLDRSVAAAFSLAREAWSSRREASCSQQHWLIDRDKCGADVDCLKREMFGRASQLAFIAMSSGGLLDDYAERCK